MVKPVNVEDLLDWIGQQLALTWLHASDTEIATHVAHQQASETIEIAVPESQHLQAILSLIDLGYVKGIHQKLDEIHALHPRYAGFVLLMRQFVQEFKLEAIKHYIEDIQHESTA